MTKNTISLIAAIIVMILIALIWYPKSPAQAPTALPTNGLTDGMHPPANAEKPASETTVPTPAAGAEPASQAAPEPEPAQPKDKAMDADDVPAGAEVAPAPVANAPKPAEDKGMVIPPSEGQ